MMKTARRPAVLGQAEEFAVLHGPQAHRLSTVRDHQRSLRVPVSWVVNAPSGGTQKQGRDNRGGDRD